MVELRPEGAEAGAAGLMLAAVGRDATEVELDAVDAGLMKLFHLARPKAQALRKGAPGEAAAAAQAAAGLPPDERERLVTLLWQLGGGESQALGAAAEAFGLSPERVAALRLAPRRADPGKDGA
jgi:hypothetical protein